ncbi:MAG: hypothetical protein A2Z40_03220 [Deltaproteobacteria bacterium RBG_19FT_COMBO_60_16]|nr:MAG: hypothetical protein A2Z40_03220 [Deltaproteobacteria bacterium RBG_19FT_COMBO_60_16]
MDIGEYISTLLPPSSSGLPRATPEEYGGEEARGAGVLAKAALEYDHAFKAQADDLSRAHDYEAAAVGASQALGNLEDELDTSPDWRTHEDRWKAGFAKIKDSIMKDVQDPPLQTALTRKLGEMESAGVLRAQGKARAMFFDNDKASLFKTLRDSKEAALSARDDIEEAQILGIGIGALETRASRGTIKREEAEKGKLLYLQDYYEGKANRDIDHDPDKFARDLLAGKYAPFIPFDRLTKLEEKYVRVKEKMDKDLDESAKLEEKRRGSMLVSRSLYGELNQADADRLLRARLISPEDHTTASRVMAKNWDEGGVSDPQAHNDLLVKMYVSPFSVSPGSIATMRGNGLLSMKDAREATKALVDLQETRGGVKDPRYNDGISKIQKSISKGPMEILSAPAARTMVLDIIEYEDRVLGKKEDPKAVSDEIALRNEERMTGLISSPIIPFDNVNELNAAYRKGKLSTKLYEAYLRILQKKQRPNAPKSGAKGELGRE